MIKEHAYTQGKISQGRQSCQEITMRML